MPINDKQEGFCQNYVDNGGNATKAYLDAGYADTKAVRFNACRLITKDNIKDRLKAIVRERKAKSEVTVAIQKQETIKLRDAAYDAKQYSAAITANDQLNKHAGFYLADNLQHAEATALDATLKAELDDYKGHRRLKLLRGA